MSGGLASAKQDVVALLAAIMGGSSVAVAAITRIVAAVAVPLGWLAVLTSLAL